MTILRIYDRNTIGLDYEYDTIWELFYDMYRSVIDRYAARPDFLENMCLAEFVANFTTRSGMGLEDEKTNDVIPSSEDQEYSHSCIKLKNNLGSMYKHNREAIIRFHRFNHEKESEKLYRSKLMLYLPWREESVDLIGEYPNFHSRYEDNVTAILDNEKKYSQNAALITETMDDLTEHGPPQHAWDQVAPGAAEQQAQDEVEGVEEERHIEQEDIDANAELQLQQSNASLLHRFTAECTREVMSPESYRSALRRLNTKQRQVVMFHQAWCKKALAALKNGKDIEPYRVFLSGPGGVGKSHVISLIRNDTVKFFRLSGYVNLMMWWCF